MAITSGFVYDMARIVADDSFKVVETIGSGGKFVLFDGSGQLRQAQAFVSGRMPAAGFVNEAVSGATPITTFLGKLIARPNIIGAGGDPAQFQEFVGASGGIATFFDGGTNLETGPACGATPDNAAGAPVLAIDQSMTIQTASGLAYLLKHPERMKKVDDVTLYSDSPLGPTMQPVVIRAFTVLREMPLAATAGNPPGGVMFCSGGSNSNMRFVTSRTSGRMPAVGITLNAQADATPVSGRSSFVASKAMRVVACPISGIGPIGGKVFIGRPVTSGWIPALAVISNGFLSGGFASGNLVQPVGVVIASGGYSVINVKPICFSGYVFPYT